MRSKATLLFIVLAGILAVAMVFLWRHDGERSLRPKVSSKAESQNAPEEKAPTTQTTHISDEPRVAAHPGAHPPVRTQNREQAIDPDEEAFRQVQECVSAYRQAMDIQGQLNVCKGSSDAHAPSCEGLSQDELKSKLEAAFRSGSKCGPDISAAETAYYDITRDLAVRGNKDAQICFAQSMFQLERPWSEEEISFYRANAPVFVQAALEQGDWRVVQLLTTSQRVLAHSRSLLGFIVPRSQFEQYKLNRLLRLGAVDNYAEQLDLLATDPELPIDAEKRKEAEDWAQKEYEKYFRNSPILHEAPQPCAVRG